MGLARYDGHADWYDGWSRAGGAPFLAAARAALDELIPGGSGAAVDVGCGTGLTAHVARRRGWTPIGVDYSADQLRLAGRRLPVAQADGRALPLGTGSARLVYSTLTHTDLDGFDRLVAEGVRVLAPGGTLVYVGVHPCFVGPSVEVVPSGSLVRPGYRAAGWHEPTGVGVRSRVGVHHLPLAELLTAFLLRGCRLDRVLERGSGQLPEILAIRATR